MGSATGFSSRVARAAARGNLERDTLSKIIRLYKPEHFELALVRSDGDTVWALVSTSGLVDAEDHWTASVGMVTDITEPKRLEQQIISAEQEKQWFCREVLLAVTRGKLHLCEACEIPLEGEVLIQAVTNAIKHGFHGQCEVRHPNGRLVARIFDEGPGIRPEDLPASILRPGFSTKVSLGMGYSLMLELCDAIWLASGPSGTVVQLEKSLSTVEEDDLKLAALLERFG